MNLRARAKVAPGWTAFCSLDGGPCESFEAGMHVLVCPFCGLASERAHDSQEACIRALQTEIARTREILTHVGESLAVPRPAREFEDDPRQSEPS